MITHRRHYNGVVFDCFEGLRPPGDRINPRKTRRLYYLIRKKKKKLIRYNIIYTIRVCLTYLHAYNIRIIISTMELKRQWPRQRKLRTNTNNNIWST